MPLAPSIPPRIGGARSILDGMNPDGLTTPDGRVYTADNVTADGYPQDWSDSPQG